MIKYNGRRFHETNEVTTIFVPYHILFVLYSRP